MRRAPRSPGVPGSSGDLAAVSRSRETHVLRPNDRALRGRRGGRQTTGPESAWGLGLFGPKNHGPTAPVSSRRKGADFKPAPGGGDWRRLVGSGGEGC